MFNNHSVNSVMKTFTKTIDRLKVVSQKHSSAANEKISLSHKLHVEATAHVEESIRADSICEKLSELIGE